MKSNNWIPEFKSIFKNELKNFILYKRSNGYKYSETMCYKLLELDIFFISLNKETLSISQEDIDNWLAKGNIKKKETTKAKYYTTISTFCDYLRMNGYENITQPESIGLKFRSEFIPYIFNDDEIRRIYKILNKKLELKKDLDTYSLYILISLYYCCGLRRNEALNLTIDDYNHNEQTITIIDGKNNITRLIPLTDSLCNIIKEYLKIRKSNNKYLFITNNNTKYYKGKLYDNFHKLLSEAKITVRYDGKRQRIHDLRHTFSVNSLKQMQTKGFDLYTALPILSIYLGHKSITETEYYLRLIQSEAENISNITSEFFKNLYNQKENFYDEK